MLFIACGDSGGITSKNLMVVHTAWTSFGKKRFLNLFTTRIFGGGNCGENIPVIKGGRNIANGVA